MAVKSPRLRLVLTCATLGDDVERVLIPIGVLSAVTTNKKQDREAVRLLAIEHGLKRAAELCGIRYDLVRQWSVRGKWKTPMSHSVTPAVKRAADTLQHELERNGRETKLSLSRYTRRVSKDAETATLRDSGHVLNVAKTHQVLFPPEQNKSQILNLAILTGANPPEKAEVIDIESDA